MGFCRTCWVPLRTLVDEMDHAGCGSGGGGAEPETEAGEAEAGAEEPEKADAEESRSSRWKRRNRERHRAYMRDYMRRRRAAERENPDTQEDG